MPLPAAAFQHAFSGDLAALKKLDIKANDVDNHDRKRGTTLLYTAARFGHFAMVRYLTALGADVNKAHKENGSRPLHGAAYGGHSLVIALLLGRGADPAATNTYGETALDNAKAPGKGVSKAVQKQCAGMLAEEGSNDGDAVMEEADDDEDDEDDEEDEEAAPEPPKKKSKKSPAAKPAVKAPKEASSPSKGAVGGSPFGGGGGGGDVKLIKKGKGVVDPMSYKTGSHHVVEEPDCLWQCTLNQTNIAHGANNNKYYIIQLLAEDGGNDEGVMVFTRWGRVGTPGATQFTTCSSLAQGKTEFCKKFRAKTQNDWAKRDDFVKHSGKYHLMDMVLGGEDDEKASSVKKKEITAKCKLHPKVQDVMEMISNKKAMEATMKELEINTDQMPLGKISKKQLGKAGEYLRKIEEELAKTKPKTKVMEEMSQNFYTLVPHDLGMCKLPVICTEGMVKAKARLLDTLGDLVITEKVLKAAGGRDDVHPLDAAYAEMHCAMEPLEKVDPAYVMIAQYVKGMHGKTHTAYKLEVEEIFRIAREGEAEGFADFAKDGNRRMLFHGSGNGNWVGILSQGLRIAPPEAPHTGYMFGKGIYFADCATKSANYCRTTSKKNVGFMTLSEVALGDMLECTAANYIKKLPDGKLSTLGKGVNVPEAFEEDAEGVQWPAGKLVEEKVKSSLLYNEYIVYNTKQVQARYFLKLKFNYGK